MSRPSPHSPHSQSFLSPTTNGNESVFTLVPELISANAARLDALSQQNSGTALDISALHSLGDVPFAGSFCHAAASALQRQHQHVAELNEYGTSAARALNALVSAVSTAEDAGAHALQSISPKMGAVAARGIGGV